MPEIEDLPIGKKGKKLSLVDGCRPEFAVPEDAKSKLVDGSRPEFAAPPLPIVEQPNSPKREIIFMTEEQQLITSKLKEMGKKLDQLTAQASSLASLNSDILRFTHDQYRRSPKNQTASARSIPVETSAHSIVSGVSVTNRGSEIVTQTPVEERSLVNGGGANNGSSFQAKSWVTTNQSSGVGASSCAVEAMGSQVESSFSPGYSVSDDPHKTVSRIALDLDKRQKAVILMEESQKTFVGQIVLHPAFDPLCSIMILGNSFLIGLVTQYDAQNDEKIVSNLEVEIPGHLFSLFFLAEMLIRMRFMGLAHYYTGNQFKWNIFDSVLVMMSIVDFCVTLGSSSNRFTGTLKLVKMLRIVRIFRLFRFCHELRVLTILILSSVRSLCWALVLIALIVYVFAVVFTQITTLYTKDETVSGFFGSLDLSTYYLVCAMLNGISWVELSDATFAMGFYATALWFFYITFMLLAVLNIINAVFVDNAIQTAKSERDLVTQNQLDMRQTLVSDLINVFNELDQDHSGEVSWEELQAFFSDERTKLYFEALGLTADDLHRLWELLDEDRSGAVGLEEFVEGCVRFKGWARSIDMYFVAQHIKRTERGVRRLLQCHGTTMPGSSVNGLRQSEYSTGG